jgi:hypothetical protein
MIFVRCGLPIEFVRLEVKKMMFAQTRHFLPNDGNQASVIKITDDITSWASIFL